MFYKWSETPPPKKTLVRAQYENDPESTWQLLMTCPHGCCVHDGIHSMVLPTFWKEATDEDKTLWETQYSGIKKMNLLDYLG